MGKWENVMGNEKMKNCNLKMRKWENEKLENVKM